MAEAERERLRSNPELPEECMREIVSRLNPKEWCRGCAVSQTFREACESDENWVTFLPPDWFAILSRTSAHLHFTSLKQLYLHLSDNPFLIDGNSMSFFLDKMSGKKCYLLSARDLCIIWGDTPFWSWVSKPESRFLPKSRFLQVAVLDLVWRFDIHCKISTSMLSPKTNYATYLVFKLRSRASGFGSRYPLNASITTTQGGEVYEQTVCLSSLAREPRLQRKDGWLEPKMGDLFNEGGKNDELEIRLREIESGRCKSGLVFEGIEIRPTNGSRSRRPLNASIKTAQGGEVYEQTVFLRSRAKDPRLKRKDGWSETKMGEFFNEGGKEDELNIRLMDVESGRWKSGPIFEGIEIRPTNAQMASSKNIQASTATSTELGMATTNNYIGVINCSQPKANNQLQYQSTKEAKVQTIISLDPLTRNKVINKDISTLEHLKYGGKSPSSFTRSWSHDLSPIKGNPKNEISCAHFNSLPSPSSWEVVSVMMTNTSTMEEKMVEMEQRVVLLTKALEDKDLQIATLMNKLKVQDLGESSHGHKFISSLARVSNDLSNLARVSDDTIIPACASDDISGPIELCHVSPIRLRHVSLTYPKTPINRSLPETFGRDQAIGSTQKFLQVAVLDLVWRFDIHCKISTSMLSPKTNYATYLVFKLRSRASGFGSRYPLNASITTTQGGEVYEQTVCLSSLAREPRLQRKDGWLEAKMGDFFNEGGKNDELEIRLREIESGRCKSGLVFEGIEIRPTNELFLGQIEW
ncbi:uncharacterized protein LOC112040241 [Quercus suber]|uniref:uncharacterized protein LOC112040241 n=1 Tax=Quercus suber TaxID=58331 RepID=UPI0032DE8A43